MFSLAALDSQGLRCLMRQSMRPQLLMALPVKVSPCACSSSLRPFPYPPQSSRRTFRLGKQNIKEMRKKTLENGYDDPLFPKKIVPARQAFDQLLPTKNVMIRALIAKVQAMPKDRIICTRISGWGIQGEPLRNILALKAPEDDRIGGKPARLMAGLMTQWGKEALKCFNIPEGYDPLDENSEINSLSSTPSSIHWDLEVMVQGYIAEGEVCLIRHCVNSFLRWLDTNLNGQPEGVQIQTHIRSLLSIGDLRFPSLKFPLARSLTRHIHLHVGPTNSGKTHGALVALCKASTGMYAGPLRLLAHEIWDRINTGAVSNEIPARACNLITGEEHRMTDALAGLTACTVEMVNYSKLVDVAVIDEIQMIGDSQRGHAWTTAVLGIPAKELHLCGEDSVIPLIERMAKACGDKLIIHGYKRLTPLQIGKPLNSNLSKIQKGDCIVAFSRNEIFKLKRIIEEQGNFKWSTPSRDKK
jgi:ATP-dependent RNA helicase SUPV3L1/SUV3